MRLRPVGVSTGSSCSTWDRRCSLSLQRTLIFASTLVTNLNCIRPSGQHIFFIMACWQVLFFTLNPDALSRGPAALSPNGLLPAVLDCGRCDVLLRFRQPTADWLVVRHLLEHSSGLSASYGGHLGGRGIRRIRG